MQEPADLKDTIVVANPGTGKTTEIVNQVISLLRSGVDGGSIACLTFTNKAAEEMKSRIFRQISNEPGLSSQITRLDVSTIHSFAKDYLESAGIRAEIQSNNVLRYIVYSKLRELHTFNYGESYLAGTIVPRIENAIRYLKSFGILPGDIREDEVSQLVESRLDTRSRSRMSGTAIGVLVRDFKAIFQSYEDYKGTRSEMDFNDLLRVFLERADPATKDFVLVDEFQDLNRMQVDIVWKLGKTRFFVGDRKQSIFGFQGGSLSSFNHFINDSTFRIEGRNINHRSTNNILDFAKHYFSRYSSDQSAMDEVKGLSNPGAPEGSRIRLIPSPSPEADAVSLVGRMLSSAESEEKDIAVITRTNSQLETVAGYLDSAGINYSTTVQNRVNHSQIYEILTYLEGLVSTDPQVVSKALITPFSGLTLREAIDLNSRIREAGSFDDLIPDNFRALRELRFGVDMVYRAFSQVIFPIASSIGRDYMSSAVSVADSAREYVESFPEYTFEGFLDYMSLTSEPVESDLRKARVNLLTVHKAKGLEFDSVIYLPTEIRTSLEYFDIMTSAIISTARGIDVEQDLLEEPLRIDFVAMTRPKSNLAIIAKDRVISRYDIGEGSYDQGTPDPQPQPTTLTRYNEPFMLFVNGRAEEAQELLNRPRRWLHEEIHAYFSGLSTLSYSTISEISKPYEFLKRKILGLRERSVAADAGTSFHNMAQQYAEGRITDQDIPVELEQEFNNFRKVLSTLEEDYQVPPYRSELKIETPLSILFPGMGAPDDVTVTGRIDALFRSGKQDGGYLIADYKTSKEANSQYWHQLWLYLRMFCRKFGINEDMVSGGIIYVSLREPVNTGSKGMDLQIRDFSGIRTDVVMNRISEILYYREKPEAFADKLLESRPQGELDSRLAELLSL